MVIFGFCYDRFGVENRTLGAPPEEERAGGEVAGVETVHCEGYDTVKSDGRAD